MFLFWGRKAFSCLRMLPLKLKKWVSCGGNDHRIDKAWSRHRVPNISCVQVRQLQSGQRFLWTKVGLSTLGGEWKVLVRIIVHLLTLNHLRMSHLSSLQVFISPPMDPGCFEDRLTDSTKSQPDLFRRRMHLWIFHNGRITSGWKTNFFLSLAVWMGVFVPTHHPEHSLL